MAQAEDSDEGSSGNLSSPTREESPVYTIIGMGSELCQAEILTNVAQYTYFPVENRAKELYHDYAILLSQDCDIAQDFEKAKRGEEQEMNEFILYEAQSAETVFVKHGLNKFGRERLQQNRDDRFHYLEACPVELDLVGDGMPALIIDFKRYFTIRGGELYRQCASAHGSRRRCRLASPYREHLQTRMAFYSQRVMLPLAHRKSPELPAKQEGARDDSKKKAF